MARLRFTGRFTQQEPISEEGIAAALAVRRRYNRAPNEVSALGCNCAAWRGVRNSLALAPSGQVLQVLGAAGAPPAEFSGMYLPLNFPLRVCDKIAEFLVAETNRSALARAP